MPREPRHPRCGRCIKQRKQCDGAQPRCGLCTTMKKADCVYPEGMPSRREYLEMEAQQQAQQQRNGDKMDVDPSGITTGVNEIMHDEEASVSSQIQGPSSHANHRRGDIRNSTPAFPSPYGRYPNAFSISAGTMPVTAQAGQRPLGHINSPSADGQHVPQQHSPSLARSTPSSSNNNGNHVSPSYQPAQQPLPSVVHTTLQYSRLKHPPSSAPSPDSNVAQDASPKARWQETAAIIQALDTGPQPADLTPEQIGINLADALEANAARHVGGILDGLSDWTSHVDGLEDMDVSGDEMKSVRETVELVAACLFGNSRL